MDKLNEFSGSLLDLIPWHAREGLDKLVTEDGERYKAVCDSVTQQVERIDTDLQRSQQVGSGMRRLHLSLNLPGQKKLKGFLFVASSRKLWTPNSLGCVTLRGNCCRRVR